MGTRTGKQYADSLRDGRRIYVNGELVRDVTTYAPFRRVIEVLAGLYDRQHESACGEALTYPSPSTGAPVAMSFLLPERFADVERRVYADRIRAEMTQGMMGRLPDFMNAWVADLASIRGLLGRRERSFGDNAWSYYEFCRESDLALTHALIDPQIDRSRDAAAQDSLRIVRENAAGLVVSGARMLSTLAPFSNEIVIAPYMPRRPDEADYAISCALPVNAPGLKFICREPYDAGRSTYDRPLSSRFDEGDAIAVFEDVLVPWDRIFAARDVNIYNLIQPSAPGLAGLQASVRGVVKLRFMTGLANLVARAVGRSDLPRYQEMLGTLVANVELAEGLLLAVMHERWNNGRHLQAGAAPPDTTAATFAPGVGSMFGGPGKTLVGISNIRIFLPQAFAHAVETIRMMGSSGLVMTPTEKDFAHPSLGAVLPRYMRGASISAQERVAIMKLAWDAIGEQFGSRSMLYELFFAGDPIANRILYFYTDTNAGCTAMAQAFLESLKG